MQFGGGHIYCPRRYFAQREIYISLALTLFRFELEVTDSESTVLSEPQVLPVEKSSPAAATIGPAEDGFYSFRQRRVETKETNSFIRGENLGTATSDILIPIASRRLCKYTCLYIQISKDRSDW